MWWKILSFEETTYFFNTHIFYILLILIILHTRNNLRFLIAKSGMGTKLGARVKYELPSVLCGVGTTKFSL